MVSKKGRRIGNKARRQVLAEAIEPRLLLSTYTVNTLSDSASPGAGLLMLRQAVADANANPGADTIAFDPTVFTSGTLHTITLTQGEITFTDTSGITLLNGLGPGVLAVSGGGVSRVFAVNSSVVVSISDLEITGGNQSTADSQNSYTYGGGIYNAGTLNVTNAIVTGNAVNASPVGVFRGDAFGGGIYSTGSLTVTNSTVSSNSVTQITATAALGSAGNVFGGGIYSPTGLLLSGDMITGNTLTAHSDVNGFAAGDASGGGVYVKGGATVLGSTISGNTAQAGDAETGSYNAGPSGDAKGGGLFATGSLVISNSTIKTNTAMGGHTGLDSGADGGAEGGGVYGGGTVSISSSTVSNNAATSVGEFDTDGSAGGGVYAVGSATITQDTINNNSVTGSSPDTVGSVISAAGGGIYVGGLLTMGQSTISGNSLTSIYPEFDGGNAQSKGGGVDAEGGGTILASTISNNSATAGPGYGVDLFSQYTAEPGGSAAGGGITAGGTLTITGSTVYGNSAIGGMGGGTPANGLQGGSASGGGINASSLTLADSTVTGNTATGGAGGPTYYSGPDNPYHAGPQGTASGGGIITAAGTIGFTGTETLTNSIISGNKVNGAFNDIGNVIPAMLVSEGNVESNIVGVGGGLVNNNYENQVGINDPGLQAFGFNGGPTETLVPAPTSPAVNRGNPGLVPAGLTTDQRGDPRIVGVTVDIGATELQTPVGTIFGVVVNDVNRNGKYDVDEPGIGGVTVYIDATNAGVLKAGDPQAVTDSTGAYSFPGLTAGNYIVRQIVPSGFKQVSPGGGFGEHLTVTAGQNNFNGTFLDQGAVTGSISGNVFNDANGNGKLDAGDVGIAGVTVYNDANNNGKLDAGEISTVTNASGVYTFSGLGAGAYLIRQILPAGDKQITPSQGFGNHVTVAANQVVSNANFGDQTTVVALASISGTVFNDANSNGKFDSGEGDIAGWELYIDLNNSGKFVSGDPEVMTDAEGDFTFNGLAAGTYIVRVIAPSGWSQTTPANGFGQHITVASGQMIKSVLFGEKEIA